MKFEKYERPDLEELELILEGSFQDQDSTGVEIGGPEPGEDEDWG